MSHSLRRPHWTLVAPVLALGLALVLEIGLHGHLPILAVAVCVPVLFVAVFAAVHHAEVIAHRIGQPFGSILLSLAVTVIEVSLIVSLLLSAEDGASTVARDTVFAAVMVVLNGIVGVCLVVGGVKHRRQGFQVQGATAALSVLGTLTVLVLILPNFTTSAPGPVYAPVQLLFVAGTSLALYGLFLYVQTVSHREDFLEHNVRASDGHDADHPARIRGNLVMLPLALLGVVLLAELLATPLQNGLQVAGLPEALAGVAVAMIVLLPEAVASIKAAHSNQLQTSLNLALGSVLASLCLTIPTVAVISLMRGEALILGLEPEHIVLLVLSLFISTLTLATGRTTFLQGGIHLVIFWAFLTITAIP